MKFFKDLLTEDDNNTFCGAKVLAYIAVGSFLFLAFRQETINLSEFGDAILRILAGSATIIGAKQFTQK